MARMLLPLLVIVMLTECCSTSLINVNAQVAADEPVVTDGNCTYMKKQMCVNGSTLMLVGKNINLTNINNKLLVLNSTYQINCSIINSTNTSLECTLLAATSAPMMSSSSSASSHGKKTASNKLPVGLYDIVLQLNNTASIRAGSLLIGTLNTYDPLPKWIISSSSLHPYRVTGRDMGNTLAVNTTFNIFGTFNKTETYSIKTFSYDSLTDEASSSSSSGDSSTKISIPTLEVQAHEQNYITVLIHGNATAYGMFGYVVSTNNSFYLPGVIESDTFAVYTPINISAISGTCAENASMCASGESITFVSNAFNVHSTSYNIITIGTDNLTQSQIQCSVTSVNSNGLTCSLKLSGNISAGVYHMYARTQICPMDMLSPSQHFADLILGKFNSDDKVKGAQIVNSAAAQYTVESVLPRAATLNTTMQIHGSFDSDVKYDVIVVPQLINYSVNSEYEPQCVLLTHNATTITCQFKRSSLNLNYNSSNIDIGPWLLMVRSQNTNYITAWNYTNFNTSKDVNSASFIALDSIAPTVRQINGSCDVFTKECMDGAELTLYGSGFTVKTMTQSEILFPNSSNVTCTITSVTTEVIKCALHFTGNVDGVWKVTYHMKVQDYWIEPSFNLGYMFFSLKESVSGWSSQEEIELWTENQYVSNKAAFVSTVVFAVLAILSIIGLIVLCTVRKVITKSEYESRSNVTWNSYNDNSYRYREDDDANNNNRNEMQSYSNNDSNQNYYINELNNNSSSTSNSMHHRSLKGKKNNEFVNLE